MSIYYCMDGLVKVRDNAESREILTRLQDEAGEIEVTEEAHGDGTMTISIGGMQEMSYSSAEELDDILREFSPHAVEPAFVTTKCDDEPSQVWIGDEAAVAKAQRNELVKDARQALKMLTADEAEELLAEAQNPEFWMKRV